MEHRGLKPARCVPAGIGSGRAKLPNKVQALLHATKLTTQTWPEACRLLRETFTFTGDLGTESRLSSFSGSALLRMGDWIRTPGDDSIKAQKTLVGQLANSLKTAASDLRSVVTKRRTDQEKKAKDENQKLQAEALAKQKDLETSEKKRLQKAKKVAPFKIDYQANGFAAVERFDSSEAFTEAPKPLAHKPFYVRNVDAISALTSDASEKLKATVDRWLVSFPASSFAREKDCVKAPLEKPWGADRAMELIEQFLPQVVQSAMPAYASKVDTVNLYGYTPHHLACDMDTDLLGFIRAQTHGEAELVLMPGSHIMKLMRDMKLNVTKVTHRSFLMGLTTDAVNRAKQLELGIFTVKQESNSVLFVPAGWMILQQTVSEGPVAGFCRSFLPKSQDAFDAALVEFKADLELNPKAPENTWTQTLCDIINAESVRDVAKKP